MTPAIELVEVAAAPGGRPVLAGVSLAVARGEVVALAGASGSGKTTLLRLVLGLETPTAGEVRLAGRPASRAGRVLVPPEERGLAVVFQDLALWPHLTVAGNLDFGLRAAGLAAPERWERVAVMIAAVGLGGRATCHPGDLSGGERQRVAIARALVSRPSAVLLDEPLVGLDVVLQGELLALFRRLLHEERTTALLVTHDPAEALALADRVAVVEDGRVVELGPPGEAKPEGTSGFARAFAAALGGRRRAF